MPIRHTDKGWFWGSKGPFATRAQAASVAKAAYASGYREESVMENICGQFVLTLMHSQTNTHILHLQARTLAEHKALGMYYEGVDDLIDSFAEAYQGKYGLIEYPVEYAPPTASIEYLVTINDYIANARQELPQDSELQNIIDEIVQLVDSTLYQLRFLK